MKDLRLWTRLAVAGAILALVAGGAFAQSLNTGSIFGTVTDADGAPLPGVQITVSGVGADKVQMTNAQGVFRFLGLDPADYTVKAELSGFGTAEYPGVTVNAGRNTAIELALTPAVEETITVTSESPLLDERKLVQGTTVSQTELEKIPTARDPWALLSQTPGVLVDRTNVGGSESGQQSIFRAQGVASDENDFMIDGVSITDMRSIGASSTYYDFDQFTEMSFSTGGTDVTKNSAGVQVNLVTKRGNNEFRGSARFYNTKAIGYFGGVLDQADIDVAGDLGDGQIFRANCSPGTTGVYCGTKTVEVQDIGFEAGGAVVRDRLWLWGSFGENDIDSLAASGDRDDTVLENTSLKVNAQINQANSFVASWNNGDKIKAGRGAGPDRAPETLWDQRGPSAIYKAEDTHVFSSNFFLTGTYSYGDFGFALISRTVPGFENGLSPGAPRSFYNSDAVWTQNFLSGYASAPNDELKIDGSYFFNTGNASHELKVGGRYRNYESFSDFAWGPENVFDVFWGVSIAQRGVEGPTTMEYFSLWAQDTITVGKATINVGLRFDDQEGTNEAVSVPAQPFFPTTMPAVSIDQAYSDFSWDSILPRIGVTYAFGQDRDTLLRASFSQFADQLSVGLSAWTAVTGEVYGYFAGGVESGFYAAAGFDPLNPNRSPNTVDPGLDAPVTTELIAQIEHSILPELVVGATVTIRNITDILDSRENVRAAGGGLRPATRADYVLNRTVNGNLASNFGGIPYGALGYRIPCYDSFDPTPGCYAGGSYLSNGARERNYEGVSVNFTKRLSNRWMARGFYSTGESEWDVPAEWAALNSPTVFRGGGQRDGQIYLERSTGSGKGERFLQSTWTANLNGMYQVAPDRPWGFNISGSMQAREGHPIPFYDNVGGGIGNVDVFNGNTPLDRFRLDDVITFDLRLEKEFALSSAVNFTFGIDAFNITNEQTALSVQTRTDSGTAGYLQDNVAPRIYRLGVRLGWK